MKLKGIKREIGIGILCLILGACNPGRKIVYAPVEDTFAEPVEVPVHKTGPGNLMAGENERPVKPEPAPFREEAVVRHYCVIVGSFRYYENAVRLRNNLQHQGFYDSSVLGSEEGIYRVSIVCEESLSEADGDLARVRSQLPQFRDAWLLEVED